MLKIQMLEQIVANENVLEDDQVASVAAAAAAASGSINSGGGSSKDENEETKSLNRHNRLSPQGRQHMGGWTTAATNAKQNGLPTTPTKSATTSPDRLRGATHDLFELLERVQCSRLDDQRCVLPSYFTQSSREERISNPHGSSNNGGGGNNNDASNNLTVQIPQQTRSLLRHSNSMSSNPHSNSSSTPASPHLLSNSSSGHLHHTLSNGGSLHHHSSQYQSQSSVSSQSSSIISAVPPLQRLLEDHLSKPAPYQMIVIPNRGANNKTFE